jgi:xanthine/uracil permease
MAAAGRATGERPAVHPVDEVLPAPRLFILGLQHLFIMYAGAVAVPLIVGGALGLPASTIGPLVNADLLVSGIATVIRRSTGWPRCTARCWSRGCSACSSPSRSR